MILDELLKGADFRFEADSMELDTDGGKPLIYLLLHQRLVASRLGVVERV